MSLNDYIAKKNRQIIAGIKKATDRVNIVNGLRNMDRQTANQVKHLIGGVLNLEDDIKNMNIKGLRTGHMRVLRGTLDNLVKAVNENRQRSNQYDNLFDTLFDVKNKLESMIQQLIIVVNKPEKPGVAQSNLTDLIEILKLIITEINNTNTNLNQKKQDLINNLNTVLNNQSFTTDLINKLGTNTNEGDQVQNIIQELTNTLNNLRQAPQQPEEE